MKSFVALFALVAIAAADVSHVLSNEATAQILKQNADVLPDEYHFEFETSNGISAQERGVLRNPGREDEGIAVEGASSYTGNDGQKYSLTYVADENGYQPQAAHLPTPQPIPEYIIRALEYIRTHAPVVPPSKA